MSNINNDSYNLLTKEYEENTELQKQNKKKDNSQMSIARSLFLQKGTILNINPKDESIHSGYWDIHNFRFNKNLDKIGSGTFGDIYLSFHKLDNKIYAIKHFDKAKLKKMNCPLEIIYKEIIIQLKLKHPNITRLYSFYEDIDNIYMILEYSNNGTLFSKIRSHKYLTEDEAFIYFIQVVNAVNFLHENNLIHRDIKPENILLDKENNVKLCDFGWCTNILENEKRKTFCGTIEYMSPELVSNEKYDKSVDIWALGILLYEMLHGYSPFKSKNYTLNKEQLREEIFENIENVEYKIDRKDQLSNECISLIQNLLQKNEEDRLTVKEIFPQPWVTKYEKIKKKELIKFYNDREKKKKENIKKNNNEHLNIFKNKNDNNISHIENDPSIEDRYFDDSKFIDYSFLKEIEEIREKEEKKYHNQNNDLIHALQIFDSAEQRNKYSSHKKVERPKKSIFENLFGNFCCELNE